MYAPSIFCNEKFSKRLHVVSIYGMLHLKHIVV